MKKKQLLSLVGAIVAVGVLGAIAYFVSVGGFSQTKSQAGLARESILREWKFNKPGQRAGWTVVGKSSGGIDRNGVLVIDNIKAQPIVLSNSTNAVHMNLKGKTSLRINTSFIPAAVTLDLSRPQAAGVAYIDSVTKKPIDFKTLPLTVTAKYTDNKGNVVTLGTQTLTGDAKDKFQELSFDFPLTSQAMPLPTDVAYTQQYPQPTKADSVINVLKLSFDFGYKYEPISISIDSIKVVQTIDVLPTSTPSIERVPTTVKKPTPVPTYKSYPGQFDRSDPIAPSGQPQ